MLLSPTLSSVSISTHWHFTLTDDARERVALEILLMSPFMDIICCQCRGICKSLV